MTAFSFLIYFVLFILEASACAETDRFKAAAKCISQHNHCSVQLAQCSIHCKPNSYVKEQSLNCRNAACKYCSWSSSEKDPTCNSWAIRHWCASFFQNLQTQQSKTPSPSQDVSEKYMLAHDDPLDCVWHGRGNHLVIDMKYIPPRGSWTRNGYGLEWKKDKPDGIDPPGSGEMCFDFQVPKNGNYYVTGLTSAPHPTDHNDKWLKLSSGIRLYRGKTHAYKYTTRKYIKAYQNLGRNKINDILSTVDHNPHYFVSEKMFTNESHTVCISGRSSKFTIFKVVFIRCWLGNGSCNRWATWIKTSVKYLIDSICK